MLTLESQRFPELVDICLLRAPARLGVSSIAPFARSGVVSN